MEFRLSENTVDSYEAYKTERNKYTGANGLDGGNWMVYKDWCEQENFICSWQRVSDTGQPNIPTKGGSAVLWTQTRSQIGNLLSANYADYVVIGVKNYSTGNKAYDGEGDGDGGCTTGFGKQSTSASIFDWWWRIGASGRVLLVRPL